MMPLTTFELGLIAVAFALAVALTPTVRALARRWGMVAQPRIDRWHRKPTALLGGVAIFAAVAAVALAGLAPSAPTLTILTASAFLWLIGLVDDLRPLKPYQKMIGQVMGAALVIANGLYLPWTPSPLLNMAITIFWLVGITNAVNLLDNMDGLAAGVSGIAAIFLAVNFLLNGQTAEAVLVLVFAAALAGFLVYNSNPASIFMGDCGSMFIGFFLASVALLGASGGRSRSVLAVLGVPVLVLAIPIFDITLVTIVRKLSGRAVSQGGRDHTSHRLVALGLSERRAVWLLYGLAALSGGLALVVRELGLDLSVAVILGFTLALTLLGVYLAGVKVYKESEIRAAQENALVAFLVDLSYKRRVFEVLLDLTLVILAYYAACALMFGPLWGNDPWEAFARNLPVLVFVKMAIFLAGGVYRGIWRYIGVHNFVVYARAVALGSAVAVLAILYLHGIDRVGAVVFVIDALLLLTLLVLSRLAFRLLRRVLPARPARPAPRVLLYGAGDQGEWLARELLYKHALPYEPVGFLDDDPLKKGKVIHGLPVLGGNGSVLSLCRQYQVDQVVLSSRLFSEDRIRTIVNDCQAGRVTVKRLQFAIEEVRLGDAGAEEKA